MQTPCIPPKLSFQPHGSRRVEAAFDAGHVSSDGGVVLLREVADATAFFEELADCFDDHRDPTRVEHSVEQLLAQRVLAIACGYEDLNDHDTLRYDPLFALAVGKGDLLGERRSRSRDAGRPLAGHATLNRLELAPEALDPQRPDLKILRREDPIRRFFVDRFLDVYDEPPDAIVLDVDPTDDPIHGRQEGRFFHGYYDSYCFLPLYVFCGNHLLVAELGRANEDPGIGALAVLQWLVPHIRHRWPKTRIIVRGDSGFCRDALMDWCEQTPGVDFVVGVARNPRLRRMLEPEMASLSDQVEQTGEPARVFKELRYQTLKSWSRERRVVAKVERLPGKENPRYVVTSMAADEIDAQHLYEDLYCARGDMENRIKEQQMGMFADRTSAHAFRANQFRLWLSAFAYTLVNEFRRVALHGTQLARAQVWTIRSKLLKLGALVRVSVRRVRIAYSSAHPLREVFARARDNIRASYPAVF